MTPAEIAAARALVDAAPTWIETENVGRPYMPDYEPTKESTDAYIGMLNALPRLLDEVERLTKEHGRCRQALKSMADCFDGAVRNVEDRGKGGQHVPYHGDFASVGPSTVSQMRRWSRDLRCAIRGEWPMTRDEYIKAFPSMSVAAINEMFDFEESR